MMAVTNAQWQEYLRLKREEFERKHEGPRRCRTTNWWERTRTFASVATFAVVFLHYGLGVL